MFLSFSLIFMLDFPLLGQVYLLDDSLVFVGVSRKFTDVLLAEQ
jgi:hypothetical protein